MRRRYFIALAGGSAVWPLAAQGRDGGPMPRVGMLMSTTEINPEGPARLAAFQRELEQLGWTEGRNVKIDVRWSGGNGDDIRKYAAELVALAPDVILASGGSVADQLLKTTRTVPIVFTLTPDPVGAGFVDSLARPGGNVTGFMNAEYGLSGKWLELLKQIAPHVKRAAVLRDAAIAQGIGQWGALQTAAPSVGMEVTPVNVRDAGEIERALDVFARSPGGGLIVPGSGLATHYYELIIAAAARHRLPAIYPIGFFVSRGGLISYGTDSIEPHR